MQGEKSLTEMLAEKRRHRELMRAQGLLEPVQEAPKEDELRQGGGGGGGNKYVPPSRKAGAPALSRDSDPSLRVSNLSENVTDHDLKTLFSSFGDVSRVYIAKDRTTQEHRGFAFVNFRNRMHAEEAMHALNGFGFDNMILHVEFAQPREQRQ
jgi:translation initiation factor 3 subunit G